MIPLMEEKIIPAPIEEGEEHIEDMTPLEDGYSGFDDSVSAEPEDEEETEEEPKLVPEDEPEAEVARRVRERHVAHEAREEFARLREERERLRDALEILEGLRGVYPNQEALARRIDQLQGRLNKQQGGR